MSLRFEFQLAFHFVEGLPAAMVEAMEFLTGQRLDPPNAWPDPDNDFVASQDATFPLLAVLSRDEPNCGDGLCSFRRVLRWQTFGGGEDRYQYTLHFRCLWLDDDFHHTWWRLVPWLAKYSDANGCVGYYKERDNPHPTLIYFRQGKVYFHNVTESPVSIIDGQPW